jgi:hypothetical protein
MQEFGAQEIANTLHILAKEKDKATGSLLLALERRAEAISRGVQLAGGCKHAVVVCDNGVKAGGADDGAAGGAGGGDIRGVQLAECCKHAVGVCDDGTYETRCISDVCGIGV